MWWLYWLHSNNWKHWFEFYIVQISQYCAKKHGGYKTLTIFLAKVKSQWVQEAKDKKDTSTSRSCVSSCWRKGSNNSHKTRCSRRELPPTRHCSPKAWWPAGGPATSCRLLVSAVHFRSMYWYWSSIKFLWCVLRIWSECCTFILEIHQTTLLLAT